MIESNKGSIFMSIRNLWFYRFYSYKDWIVASIMLVVLHLLLLPFFLWAIELIICHDYLFLVLTVGISSINIGMYIRAVALFLIDVRNGLVKRGSLHKQNENVMM